MVRDDRAAWEKPALQRLNTEDAEIGTSTGADLNNTAGGLS